MWSAILCLLVTVLSLELVHGMLDKKTANCSAGEGKDPDATLACFTCLGRDSVNCDWGNVCCKGSCFKLVDEEHDIIAKGCTNKDEEDGSMKRKTTEVGLYWANDEKLQGKAYYCKSKDYCNGSSSIFASLGALLMAIGIVRALA